MKTDFAAAKSLLSKWEEERRAIYVVMIARSGETMHVFMRASGRLLSAQNNESGFTHFLTEMDADEHEDADTMVMLALTEKTVFDFDTPEGREIPREPFPGVPDNWESVLMLKAVTGVEIMLFVISA